MTTPDERDTAGSLSAETAFSVLGNETRLQILEVLGDADGPLSYTELFDRIEYEDSANFTYHLQQLVGHFLRKTDDGYAPRLPGRRVIEAIYSGVVTDELLIERTATDLTCMYCGQPTEMAYYDEVAVVYCSECEGRIGNMGLAEEWPIPADDIVGYVSIPPAGVYGRTPTEILEAAGIWTVADVQAIVREVCPRCAAQIERSAFVCDDHARTDDFCEQCNHQFGVRIEVQCTNCIFRSRSPYPTHALGNLDLVAFMTAHEIDPFASDRFHLSSADEEILSIEPLEARYTFSVDGDSISLTVAEDLSVSEVTRREPDSSP